jgi:uncharacterized protein (TIGR03435 family)
MRPVIRVLLLGTLIAVHAIGNAQLPTFASATIRLNSSESASGGVQLQPGGVLTVTNTAPRDMIRFVFNLPASAVVGGPAWLATERYDIVANANRDVTRDEAAQMLKALLVQHFKLQLREETRAEPVYELTLVTDRRLGPRLTPTKTDCAAVEGDGADPCRLELAGGSITVVGRPMTRLARTLGGLTGRVVLDKTGLSGDYDLSLTWTPEPIAGPAVPGSSLFRALEEQLGLTLVDTQGSAPALVIESAERPAE